MAKICIFTQTLNFGGAEKNAVLLANSLQETHKVYLLVYFGNRIDKRLYNLLYSDNVQLVKLQGNIFSKLLFLCRFFRKNKIDILFSMLLRPNLIGGLIGRTCGVAYPIGGIRSAQLDKSKVWLNKILQNHVNKLTIYNNYKGFEAYSKKGFNPKKALVIPNSLETIPARIIREEKETTTIISVGRFHPAKDYFTALKAIEQLKKENVSFKYLLIGYGELERNIRTWVKELGLENQVEIVINPDNLKEYFEQADIFLLTSIFEGLPNVVLEGMSFSLPVVSTRVGDVERIVQDGKTGYVCEPKDFLSISDKLNLLINNNKKRVEFGQNGYEIVNKEYSFSGTKEKYLHLIDSLIET